MNNSKSPAPVKVKNKSGLEEAVSFPDLNIFERQQAVTLLCDGRTPELVMLCLRKNDKWLNSLEPDSYLALINPTINFVFPWALRVAANDPIMGLKVGPILMQMRILLESIPSTDSAATSEASAKIGSETPSEPAPLASAAPIGAPASATLPAGSPAS